MGDAKPVAMASAVRDNLIFEIQGAALGLLTSTEELNIEKAVRALDAMLDVAVAQVEALSHSSVGCAERDLPTDTRLSLAKARGHLRKLRTLYYPKEG